MRRLLWFTVFFISSILMIAPASAEPEAVITPSSPDTVVLEDQNDASETVEFDGTASSGDIVSYDWVLVEEDEGSSGPTAGFEFDRDSQESNTIQLIVTDEDGNSDSDEVTQQVEDRPVLEIDSNTTDVEIEGEVEFTVERFDNEFDGPVEWNWTVDGTEEESGDGEPEDFERFFDQDGESFDVTLNVIDQAGNSNSRTIQIDVLKEPEYEVTIDGTNSPIDEGDTLEVDVDVENTGGFTEGGQDIELEIDDDHIDAEDNPVDSQNIEVDGGDTEEITLEWSTEDGDAGEDIEIEVSSDNDLQTKDITVEEVEDDDDGDDNGDDDGNGGAGAPEDDEDDFDESAWIGSVFDGDVIELQFSDSSVTDIELTFTQDVSSAELTSTVHDDLPDSASGEPTGEVYEYIEYGQENFDNDDIESARFDFNVDNDWIEDNEIFEESISLKRYDDGWESLDTTVEDEDSDNLYLSAESSGFSVFSISGEVEEADIQVTDLEVSPLEVDLGENVSINATVENLGNIAGDHTVTVEVGDEEEIHDVEDLEPGDAEAISLERSFEEDGEYSIQVEDLSETVTAGDPQPDIEEVEEEDEGGMLLILFVSLLVILLIIGASVTAYLMTYDEKREEAAEELDEIIDRIKEKLGYEDEEEDEEEEFEWGGFNH